MVKQSQYPKLTIKDQARRAPLINAVCRAVAKVLPQNGTVIKRQLTKKRSK